MKKDKKLNIDINNIGLGNHSKENLSREDILYPTMKNKKDEGILTGGAASIEGNKKEYIENLKKYIDEYYAGIK